MAEVKYNSPGGIYVYKKQTMGGGKGLSYRRFKTGAEAIRFAMEDVPKSALGTCTLETDGQRFDAKDLRKLYESSLYPLPRAPGNRD
jgi:hypothetical protein